MALLAARAFLGLSRNDHLTEFHSGRYVLVETDRQQPVQLDGNDVGESDRLEVVVEPGALLVVRPAEIPQPVHAAVVATSVGRAWLSRLLFLVVATLAWWLRRR